MSPTMQMAPSVAYTTTSDAMNRHNDYGITKRYQQHPYSQHAQHHQSPQLHANTASSGASTGGGRAWSDDEEVYLLQTRLQKMPYKHIAAHLRKTELACRLHYHQLSHGSNRRKRTASVSSGSSSATTANGRLTGSHSPPAHAAAPAQVREHSYPLSHPQSRTPSPPASSYSMSSGGVQLPAIMSSMASSSPRLLPAILPKPVNVSGSMPSLSPNPNPAVARPSSAPSSSTPSQPAPAAPHNAPLLPAATFTSSASAAPTEYSDDTDHSDHARSGGSPSLRLDCNGTPESALSASGGPQHPVDMGRLYAVYAAHRASFWSAIASEYGHGSNPAVLEQAWRVGFGGSMAAPASGSAPLTPSTSHDDRDLFYGAKGAQSQDKTRIAAILGIDANPRSPKEREMVRRLEEERVVVAPVA